MKCCILNCNKEVTNKVPTYWNLDGEYVCSKHKDSILKNISVKSKRLFIKNIPTAN